MCGLEKIFFITLRLLAFSSVLLLLQDSISNLLNTAKSLDEPVYFFENFRKILSITPRELPIWKLSIIFIYIFFEVFTKKHMRTVCHFFYFGLIALIVACIFENQFELISQKIFYWRLNYLQFFSGTLLLACGLYFLWHSIIVALVSSFYTCLCWCYKKSKNKFTNKVEPKKEELLTEIETEKGFIVDEALAGDDYNNEAGKELAKQICNFILETKNDQSSFGIGIEGEWGCGKTSFINLLEKTVIKKKLKLAHFKPYLLTNTRSFEKELMKIIAAQYNSPRLNDMLNDYWKAFKKISSPIWQFFYLLFNKDETIHDQYKKISNELLKKKKKLVIILDDIDRLDSGSLRMLIKLVKQIASFPYVFFIFAYDPNIIKKRLKGIDSDEETFLEKIITFNFSLPLMPNHRLKQIFKMLLHKYIDQSNQSIEDFNLVSEQAYKEVFKNPRSIKRILNHYMISYSLFRKNIRRKLESNENELINKQLFVLSILHCNFYEIYSELKKAYSSIYKPYGKKEFERVSENELVIASRRYNEATDDIFVIVETYILKQSNSIQELLNLLNTYDKRFEYMFVSKEYQHRYFNFELDLNEVDPKNFEDNMEVLNDKFEG